MGPYHASCLARSLRLWFGLGCLLSCSRCGYLCIVFIVLHSSPQSLASFIIILKVGIFELLNIFCFFNVCLLIYYFPHSIFYFFILLSLSHLFILYFLLSSPIDVSNVSFYIFQLHYGCFIFHVLIIHLKYIVIFIIMSLTQIIQTYFSSFLFRYLCYSFRRHGVWLILLIKQLLLVLNNFFFSYD